MGESGSGKSTLLSLIQKIYPLNRGNILIGKTNVQHIASSILRRKIAVVPQQIDFFQGTVISNIALGDYTPSLERIYDICQKLGIHEFVKNLPMQYDTVIRENGNNLSGGQKQKLGIARALYLDPSILILDEATSALDQESERKVLETLTWFQGLNKTIIIISHRPEPIKWCDSVIYLKQGGLPISGRHEQLLKENPDYAVWWGMSTG
jgi:ATP-binding cassette, subfamily C, bacteriocin exporter